MTIDPRSEIWGCVHVYTGDGKGKTTAALGVVLRAIAVGKRVTWIAFDKGGESHYSERSILRERMPELTLHVTGLDRIDPETRQFRFGVTDKDRTEGMRGLRMASDALKSGNCDVLVLDEINSCAAIGIVSEAEVLHLIQNKTANVELILTGRSAPETIRNRADLVTEMRLEKHYFYRGIPARKGIDY